MRARVQRWVEFWDGRGVCDSETAAIMSPTRRRSLEDGIGPQTFAVGEGVAVAKSFDPEGGGSLRTVPLERLRMLDGASLEAHHMSVECYCQHCCASRLGLAHRWIVYS